MQFFSNAALCFWREVSDVTNIVVSSSFGVKEYKKNSSWTTWTWKMQTPLPSVMSGTTHLAIKSHIPHDFNLRFLTTLVTIRISKWMFCFKEYICTFHSKDYAAILTVHASKCNCIQRPQLQLDKNILVNREFTHCQMNMTLHTLFFREVFYIALHVW
jgi:hypothetical protein